MSEEKEQKNNKGIIIILLSVVGVLTLFSIFTGYRAFIEQPEHISLVEGQKEEQQTRADRLQKDADRIKSILDKIGSPDVDSLANGYQESVAKNKELQDRVKKLQKMIDEFVKVSGTSDPETAKSYYRQIKAEAFRLRNEVRKLKKRNQELIAENAKLKDENAKLGSDLDAERANSSALKSRSEELQAQVNVGKKLRTYDLIAEGIKVRRNGKEKVTSRARRAQKIRVAFTIDENTLTDPGMKKVYLVVKDPKNNTITDGGSNFNYKGEELAYTSVEEITYENKSKDVVMYAKNFFAQNFEEGDYNITVYCDGALIGTSKVFLK